MAQQDVQYPLSHLSDTRGDVWADFTNTNDVTFVNGKVGKCANFVSASSKQLESSNSFYHSITDEDFHMVGWIKLDTTGVNHGLFGQTTNSYHCHVISTNKVRFRVRANSTNYSLDSTETLSSGTWYRISCGYDHTAGETFLQIDEGTKQTKSLTGDSLDTGTQVFTLGSIAGGNYMNGQIDQFMMRREGLYTTTELSDHYNSGSGAAFSTELELDYATDSDARRVKVQAKSAQISGSGSQDCLILTISEDQLPAELHDSDETATVEASGAGSLRASTDEAGTNPIPLHVVDFTPASSGGTAEIKLNPGTLDGTSGTDVYLWWLPSGHGKTQPGVANVYGRNNVPDENFGYYFLMDEDPTSGTSDITGNHSTTSIGTMVSGDVVAGKVGSGTDFDGTDDGLYIQIPAFPAAGTDFAVGAWVKPVDKGSGFPSISAIRHSHTGSLAGMFFDYEDSTGKFRFSIRDNGTDAGKVYATAESTTSVSFGSWQHVVGRFDDSAFETEIFYNGSSEDTASQSGTRFTADNLQAIGYGRFGASTNVDFFEGVIDEKWRYDGTLTDDQITTLYNNQNDPESFWDHTFAVTSPAAVNGTISLTDGGETVSFAGDVPITGTLSITDGGEALSFTGNVPVSGTLALTDGGETLAFSGTVDSNEVNGTFVLTDGGESLSFSGGVIVSGTMTLTDGGETMSFSNITSLVATNPFVVKEETRIFKVYA